MVCVCLSVLPFIHLSSIHPFIHVDVNVAFRQAMTKLGIEDETLLHQFQLIVPPPPDRKGVLLTAQKPKAKIHNSWDQLGLSFKPKWPLHILFTSAVLEKSVQS